MGSSWIEALKKWNSADNKSGNWCVPKKGTSDYEAVRKYMGSSSGAKMAPAKKEKKMLALPKGAKSKPVKKAITKVIEEVKKDAKKSGKGPQFGKIPKKFTKEEIAALDEARKIAGQTGFSRKEIEAGKKEASRLLAEEKKKKGKGKVVVPAKAPEPAKPTMVQPAEKINVLVPKSKKVIKS